MVGIDCDCLASGETMLDDMNELDGFYKEHKKFIIQTKNKTYNNMINSKPWRSKITRKFQLSFIEFLEEATEVKTVTATPKEPKDSKTVERGTVQGKEQPKEKKNFNFRRNII